MNREIVGGGGAAVYPLVGDVKSTAGQGPVAVVGIQNIPVVPSFPTGGEVLTYDGTSNTLSLEAPVQQIELETNGTPNSTQTLLNIAEGTNITITETAGTVTINSSASGIVTRGPLLSNANGQYWVWSDGVVEQWGHITLTANTTELNSGTITFPIPFPTFVDNVTLTLVGLPKSGQPFISEVQVNSQTLSNVLVSAQSSVAIGGGGSTFDQNVQVFWRAIGN